VRPELFNDGVESLGPLLVVGLVGRHHGSLRPDEENFTSFQNPETVPSDQCYRPELAFHTLNPILLFQLDKIFIFAKPFPEIQENFLEPYFFCCLCLKKQANPKHVIK